MEKDPEILQLFPTLTNRLQLGGNSREGLDSCMKIIKLAAKEGSVTQYRLIRNTREQKRLFKGVASARDCLKELTNIGLLKIELKDGKRGRQKKECSLTAKGVIACLAFPEFQKTNCLQELLNNGRFHGDKLVALLRIYNEGYGQRTPFPQKFVVSPCVEIAKKLAFQESLNLELATDEKIIQKLRTVVDDQFKAALQKTPSLYEMMLLTQNTDFQKNLATMGETMKGLNQEEMQQVLNQSIHSIIVLSSPELLAWTGRQQRKQANIQQTLKGLQESVKAKIADSALPFESPQDFLDRSLDALRNQLLDELSQE